MPKKIFALIFTFSCIIQGYIWSNLQYFDENMWAYQGEYLLTNNPEAYNSNYAYGHPGGPIIEGVILIHGLIDSTNQRALHIFLTLFNSLIIASIAFFCYKLRKKTLWWIVAPLCLALNNLYIYGTPPSIVVSLLITLLSLITIYLYEKEKLQTKDILLFGIISGLSIATRFDIGGIMTFTFIIILFKKINYKKLILLCGITGITFIIFDPFMWIIPIKHIHDIFQKIFYHYKEFNPTHLTLLQITGISGIAFLSMIFGLFFIIIKKDIISPLKKYFLNILLITTVLLYTLFLTSHYQAERYFMPMIFIWETLLPLFIFKISDKLSNNSNKKEKIINISFICIILTYQIILTYLALIKYK